jgi:CHAT domain-containing protein
VFTARFGEQAGAVAASVTPNAELLADPRGQLALVGLIEARRNRALVLRAIGRLDDADAAIRSAIDLAEANGIARPILSSRLYRTVAVTAASSGANDTALADLLSSTGRFRITLPGSKTLAETELLRAGGTAPSLMAPCLDAFAAAADRDAGARQGLLREMFVAAQLAKGSITSEQIAQVTARLRESARGSGVAEAIRRWQDASDALAELYRQRDELAAAEEQGRPPPGGVTQAEMDKRVGDARAALAEADTALQAASPNFGQLVQQVVPAADVLAALRPDEAFVSIVLSDETGWVFVLRAEGGGGRVFAARITGGTGTIAALVRRLRDGVEPTENGLPAFDIAAAQGLYAATLGQLPAALDGATAIVVAPAGPLLSVPFAVLLTGPASADQLAGAPWLIRRAAIAHVPSAANFVTLRKVGPSAGTRPWFGFGGFRPVTLTQAKATFPAAACADSALLFAGLPPLPAAERELDAARHLLGATPSDEMLDSAFTADAVRHAHLKDYRVLHFATHALLPAELRCVNEAAIVTSAPSNARDASGALLTASEAVGLDLDADLIILSACNSAGPGGRTAGESLSGLARAFFYAGTRSLMVTHWSVNDQAAAYLVAETLRRQRATPGLGIASAVQGAELAMLDGAGHGLPAEFAHPFFWAPFAVIGDVGGAHPAAAPEHTAEL